MFISSCLLYFFIAFRRNQKERQLPQEFSSIGIDTNCVDYWLQFVRALIKRTTNWRNFHVHTSSPSPPSPSLVRAPFISKALLACFETIKRHWAALSLSNHFTYNYLVTELSWYEYFSMHTYSLNGSDFYSSSRRRSYMERRMCTFMLKWQLKATNRTATTSINSK